MHVSSYFSAYKAENAYRAGMASDLLTATSLGRRVKAARRRRGFKSAAALAEAADAPQVTPQVVMNIESGRTPDPTVSQLLNIAAALQVSPALLLAPLGRRRDGLDLVGLTPELSKMTVSDFDAWLSAGEAWQPSSPAGWEELHHLEAVRNLDRLFSERARLRTAAALEDEALKQAGQQAGPMSFGRQAEDTEARIQQLKSYLENAGWDLSGWGEL